MNLIKSTKITVANTGAAAGQTEVDTSVLDMSGWDGVMFIASLGTVTDNSVLTLTVKGNTANSVTLPAPITQKATAAFTASASSNTALVVEVAKPVLRYVFAALTRTAQNAVVNNIIAIQYIGKEQPTTQDATVIASAFGLGVAA